MSRSVMQPERPLSPLEQELAARCAVVAAPLFERFGWTYADDEVSPAEALAETIAWLISVDEGSTGRFLLTDGGKHAPGDIHVYLHLGSLFAEGPPYVEIDDTPARFLP